MTLFCATVPQTWAQATVVEVSQLDTALEPVGAGASADAIVTLSLASPQTFDITIRYRSNDVTATSGLDYEPVAGTVVIPAGQTTAQVRVPVLGDGLREETETFALSFHSDQARVRAEGDLLKVAFETPLPGFGFDAAGSKIVSRGEWLFVGVPAVTHNGVSTGAVHILRYQSDSQRWVFAGTVVGEDSQLGARFGASIDVDASGELLAIGAPGDETERGAVYFFRPDAAGIWVQQLKLTLDGASEFARFGSSVQFSFSGDRLLANEEWTTRIFKKDAEGGWSPDGPPLPVNSAQASRNGFVAVDKSPVTGGHRVFEIVQSDAGGWTPGKVIYEAPNEFSQFVQSIASSGDYVAISERDPISEVSMYQWQSDKWELVRKFSQQQQSDFGSSISLSGSLLAAGSRPSGLFRQGIVRIFEAAGPDDAPWDDVREVSFVTANDTPLSGFMTTLGESVFVITAPLGAESQPSILELPLNSTSISIQDSSSPQINLRDGGIVPIPDSNDHAAVFAVTLDTAAETPVVLGYKVGGTAVTGTVEFEPGQTLRTIVVPGVPFPAQPVQTLQVELTSTTRGTFATRAASVSLVRPASPIPPVTVTANPSQLDEPQSGARLMPWFIVSLKATRTADTPIGYRLIHRNGPLGQSAVYQTGIALIPAGELTARVDVGVEGDATPEPDEIWMLSLDDSGAAPLAPAVIETFLQSAPAALQSRSMAIDRSGHRVVVSEVTPGLDKFAASVFDLEKSSGQWRRAQAFAPFPATVRLWEDEGPAAAISGDWIALAGLQREGKQLDVRLFTPDQSGT